MRRTMMLTVLALVLTACQAGPSGPTSPGPSSAPGSPGGGSPAAGPNIYPLLINSEIVAGPNRFVFSLTDRENRLIAAPDVSVSLEYFDVATDPDKVAFTGEARFLWAIEGESGLYVTSADFPSAGRWGTRFTATFPDGRTEQVRADYDVAEAGRSIALGSEAPPVDTPTLDDVGGDVAALSTDDEALLRLYDTSIEDALAAGEPFVVAFATPAFCETRMCGPALDTFKAVANERQDVTFINVEPYRMKVVDGSLQPELDAQGQLQTAPWTDAWGLPSEPYTFVIAADGTVAAKFEGVFGEDELRSALDSL